MGIIMRINVFNKLIAEAMQALHCVHSQAKGTQNVEYYTIHDWEMICNTLHKLSNFEFLHSLIDDIFQLGIHFRSPTPKLVITVDAYQRFKAKYDNLRNILEVISSMSTSFFQRDEENQINIKLPDNISLSDMSEQIKELDFIFGKLQALRKINENNDFVLKRVDTGSIWLILAVAVPTAVATIGAIVKIAMDVKRRLLDDAIIKEKLRVLKSGANAIENIEKELSAELKKDCNVKAAVLNEDNNLELNPEELSTLSMGIERLANLLFAGVKFYASLEASDAVANAFPHQEARALVSFPKPSLPSPDSLKSIELKHS